MAATILNSVPLQASTATPSTRSRRVGLALTGVAVLFLVFDVVMKFIVTPEAVQATSELGWPMHHMPLIGMIELICLTLYLIPRTAPLGAILWTGYLGGAIATHVRIGNPLFSHILFPVYIATLLWLGLWLRDRRLRALLPLA